MRHKNRVIAGAVLILAQGAAALADQGSCEEQLKKRNYSAAIASAKEALRGTPKDGAVHYCLGEAYRRRGELPKALQELQLAKEFSTEKLALMNVHNRLGMTYSTLNDDEEALKHYGVYRSLAKELGKKDEESSALNNMAVIYYNRGQHSLALMYFENSLKLSPNEKKNAATYGNIATVYLSRAENDKAIEYQQKAISIDRKNKDAHSLSVDLLNLGSMYRLTKSYDDARRSLFEGLEGVRKAQDAYWEGMAHRYIGWLYSDRGELVEARKWMTGAAEIFTRIGAASDAEKMKKDLEALAQQASGEKPAPTSGAVEPPAQTPPTEEREQRGPYRSLT